MSVQSEIDRIKGNVAGAYSAVSDMGGTLPEQQVSGNLAAAIRSIPSGGSPATPLDPAEVYSATRPADWLPMPEPAGNEMYLLFHIPDGVSSLLAFTVTCTGSYTVALGTVTNGRFVQQSAVSVASKTKYETELLAEDFGNLTSDGFKQVMIKISGADILTWEPSTHSKKRLPANFFGWNIVELSCRLPVGSKVAVGNRTSYKAVSNLRYFSWFGANAVASMNSMFNNCYNLIAVLQLDSQNVTGMNSMFNNCCSLIAIPQLDTSTVTDMQSMFNQCRALTAVPQLDTSELLLMSYMFAYCSCLTAVPQLITPKVTSMNNMFTSCYDLIAIPRLDASSVTSLSSAFSGCEKLAKIKFNPAVTGWGGVAISLSNCSLGHQALVDLFNSLPTITSAKALTLTGNPGVAELTDAEKAIATNKNWTLTL